jgi:hypothetical protein
MADDAVYVEAGAGIRIDPAADPQRLATRLAGLAGRFEIALLNGGGEAQRLEHFQAKRNRLATRKM